MYTLKKIIPLFCLLIPLISFADKMKFTFTNTTDDIFFVHLFQGGFCSRNSSIEKFNPKTTKQFYTAEGSFCDPSGHWTLVMQSYVYGLEYELKVTEPNGVCQMTAVSGNRLQVFFSGNCKKLK